MLHNDPDALRGQLVAKTHAQGHEVRAVLRDGLRPRRSDGVVVADVEVRPGRGMGESVDAPLGNAFLGEGIMRHSKNANGCR